MNTPIITARKKGADEAYVSLAGSCLRTDIIPCAGSEQPALLKISITADEAFEGVIRIALPVNAQDARFFLPGFMYGTNRGDAPLVVDSPCPRLRPETEFPASPWWMTRSDRLSHPCAFIYSGGRLCGFAAAPYFVRVNGQRTAWEPGIAGEFDQYAGFGCALPGTDNRMHGADEFAVIEELMVSAKMFTQIILELCA